MVCSETVSPLFGVWFGGKSQPACGGGVLDGESPAATWSAGISPFFHNFLNFERRF